MLFKKKKINKMSKKLGGSRRGFLIPREIFLGSERSSERNLNYTAETRKHVDLSAKRDMRARLNPSHGFALVIYHQVYYIVNTARRYFTIAREKR